MGFFNPRALEQCGPHPACASQESWEEAYQKEGKPPSFTGAPEVRNDSKKPRDALKGQVSPVMGGRRKDLVPWCAPDGKATCEKTGDRVACRIHIPKCHLAIQPARVEKWADGEIIFSLKILYL